MTIGTQKDVRRMDREGIAAGCRFEKAARKGVGLSYDCSRWLCGRDMGVV